MKRIKITLNQVKARMIARNYDPSCSRDVLNYIDAHLPKFWFRDLAHEYTPDLVLYVHKALEITHQK